VTNLQNTVDQAIPVYIPEEKFNEIILPLLWQGSRGPLPKVSYYKLFHYILFVLYTGIQWKMLPIDKDQNGKPEIHYTNVWRKWDQWVRTKSIERIFEQSVRLLKEQGKLDLRTLSGDSSNVVAKKGGKKSAIAGINTRREIKYYPFLIMPVMFWPQWFWPLSIVATRY
jgi:hypothetical protein